MQILYADNHIVVSVKPAGMVTESGQEVSLEDVVKVWAKEHYQKPGDIFIKPVHRLDKPASGIVLFAKTSKALTRLHAAFRERKIEKTYLALLEGNLVQEEGVLEDFLLKEDFRAKQSLDPSAKLAKLSYKVCARSLKHTLVQVHLHTGRYHQIRAQFSSRGHPIVGDQKYGSKDLLSGGQIALHHAEISFFHPVSGQKMTFSAPSSLELLSLDIFLSL